MLTNIDKSTLVSYKDIQPTQLYLNATKMVKVIKYFNRYEPEKILKLPVIERNGVLILTDAHTRAFVAYLMGVTEFKVYEDPDDLNLASYDVCVGWCQDEEIKDISHLVGRVVSNRDYKKKWIRRCQTLANKMAAESAS